MFVPNLVGWLADVVRVSVGIICHVVLCGRLRESGVGAPYGGGIFDMMPLNHLIRRWMTMADAAGYESIACHSVDGVGGKM